MQESDSRVHKDSAENAPMPEVATSLVSNDVVSSEKTSADVPRAGDTIHCGISTHTSQRDAVLKSSSSCSAKPLDKLIHICRSELRFINADGRSVIRIPQWGALQGFSFVSLVVTGIVAIVAIFAWIRGAPTGWIGADMLLFFSVSLYLLIQTVHYYELDPEAKTLHYFYRNPFYYEQRQIQLPEVAGIQTTRTIKKSLIFHHKVDVSSVLILRNGITLNIISEKCGSGYQNAFFQQMERTKTLADCMEWPYFESHLRSVEDATAWRAATNCPDSILNILWENELANVGLSPVSGTMDEVKVDLSTALEKICLMFVGFVFVLTTGFLLFSEWTVLKDNPRLFYLLLLDAGSILVSVFAAWRWLIDEYYVIDIRNKRVLFSSRILFFKRRECIANFSEVASIALQVSRQPDGRVAEMSMSDILFFLTNFQGNPQLYYAELLLKDNRAFPVTDGAGSPELVILTILGIAGLIGCPSVDKKDSPRIRSGEESYDSYGVSSGTHSNDVIKKLHSERDSFPNWFTPRRTENELRYSSFGLACIILLLMILHYFQYVFR
ncbi:MAG: hypothetical protein HQM09_03730 [Candidatus Riflebacteria bacterium]|nr:hypothetical protein [Candidatus Riflebacteria bacterium]